MDRKNVGLRSFRRRPPVLILAFLALILSLNQAQTSLEPEPGYAWRTVEVWVKTVNVQGSPDTQPPLITNISHTPSYPQPNQKVVVSAKVVDNSSGVKTVILSYRERLNYNWYGIHQYWGVYEWTWEPLTWNIYTDWIDVKMTLVKDDTYKAELLELPYYSTVWYRVYAVDNAGNSVVSDNQLYEIVRGAEYIIYLQASNVLGRVLYVAVGLALVHGLGRAGRSNATEREATTSEVKH